MPSTAVTFTNNTLEFLLLLLLLVFTITFDWQFCSKGKRYNRFLCCFRVLKVLHTMLVLHKHCLEGCIAIGIKTLLVSLFFVKENLSFLTFIRKFRYKTKSNNQSQIKWKFAWKIFKVLEFHLTTVFCELIYVDTSSSVIRFSFVFILRPYISIENIERHTNCP